MIGILIYFSILFFLYFKVRKEKSIRTVVFALYAFSAAVSFSGFIYYPYKNIITTESIAYFIVCTLILLFPIYRLGVIDQSKFNIPLSLMKRFSLILIPFGMLSYVFTIPRLFTIQTLVVNLSDIRSMYYSGDYKSLIDLSLPEIIANWFSYIQFFSPFLCLYFYTMKDKVRAILLLIVSFVPAVNNMLIGEREATVIVLSNFIFSYAFFKPSFSLKDKIVLKRLGVILALPFMLFVTFMTLDRFGKNEDGVLGSLFHYIGEQPFNFSYFYEKVNMDNQMLMGRLSFGYLFPEQERLTEQINYYVNADIYLNVFAGIPGSLYFDFGKYSIFICILISLLFLIFVKGGKMDNNYKLSNLFFYIIYLQFIFMGIFYFDFKSKYQIYMCVLLFVGLKLYNRAYDKRT